MSLALDRVAITLGGRLLVANVSLELNRGEVVGLLGPNGAGKTTTFNLVTGLLRPDEGDVLLDGESVADLPMPVRARRGIGYLPQEASVFRQLSVRDNLRLALAESGTPPELRRARLETLIEDFHLSAFQHRLGYQLSGGERRRCEVARALAVGAEGPRYLLLDEPFAGVDPLAVADLQDLIHVLRQRGMGVLITDHNVRETLATIDRAYILTEGSILASGSSAEVAANPLVRRHYLGESFALLATPGFWGGDPIEPVEVEPPEPESLPIPTTVESALPTPTRRRDTWQRRLSHGSRPLMRSLQTLTRPVRPWLRRIPLLDRWLTSELMGPLLFGIAAFTAVSLSVGVVFELVRRVAESGLPLVTAMVVLALRLPGFLVLSFPMATLMATLLAYSRLSGSSELTALRSVGVSTRRMVVPALALAVLMSLLTFVFNDLIVPRANLAATNTLERALGRALSSDKGDNILYSRFGLVTQKDGDSSRELTHIFYSRKYRSGEMQDVTLIDFSRLGQRQMLIARTGQWNDDKGMWEFRDGRILNIDERTGGTTSAQFDRYLYPLGRDPQEVAKLPTDASLMTVGQARRAERLLREANNAKEARRLRVRIQEKFAFPAICLVFGLIGSSLGVRPHSRTSRSQGFGISVLLIFGYYLMSFIFSSLGINGSLAPIPAAWLPVILGLGAGTWLLQRASR
jgi:lipopolysaccharide export system permease protein